MLEVIISFSDNVIGIRLLKIALINFELTGLKCVHHPRANSKCYPKNEEHIIVSTS